MKERIYTAGPYTPKDCTLHDASRVTSQNVDRAIEAANALMEKGHYVFVPHLTHYIHIHPSCKRDYGDWYYELDMTFLTHWATAFFHIASSPGVDEELRVAEELGLKIFRSLEEVPDANQ